MVVIKDSQGIDIIESVFTDINQLLVQIQSSYEIKLDQINASNIVQAIKVTQKSSVTIINSSFNTILTDSIIYGGALQIENSNLQMNKTSFSN